ncbi:hypothetical protein D915_011049 [Fasciola hepatica]|uniref:Uncharacterized protein n=1 Tax=Fasciola hepatica TaxID=6192 RepID=A0A4E0QT95_FASHE|nr:hypothetical protein D915_011049 [Fasciola hepatica]
MSEGSEDASVSSFEVFDHSNDLILLDNMLERVTDMDDFAFDEPKLGEESPKADSAESLSDLQETQKPSEFGSAHPSIAELETSTHSSSATPLTACEKCPMKEEDLNDSSPFE